MILRIKYLSWRETNVRSLIITGILGMATIMGNIPER